MKEALHIFPKACSDMEVPLHADIDELAAQAFSEYVRANRDYQRSTYFYARPLIRSSSSFDWVYPPSRATNSDGWISLPIQWLWYWNYVPAAEQYSQQTKSAHIQSHEKNHRQSRNWNHSNKHFTARSHRYGGELFIAR